MAVLITLVCLTCGLRTQTDVLGQPSVSGSLERTGIKDPVQRSVSVSVLMLSFPCDEQ